MQCTVHDLDVMDSNPNRVRIASKSYLNKKYSVSRIHLKGGVLEVLFLPITQKLLLAAMKLDQNLERLAT